MKKRKTAFLVASLGLCAFIVTSAFAKGDFIEKKENLNLPLDDKISKLVIDVGAGYLKVEGQEDSSNIDVEADLKVYADNYKLTLVRKGNKAILRADANINEKRWKKYSSSIDLNVTVPASLELLIEDGSGDVEIVGIKNDIVVDDGSGDMTINRIGGKVVVDDGSGDLSIGDVASSVIIDDGSGDLNLERITGTVRIDDGSGHIRVMQIAGKVTIDDGSGDIHLDSLKSGVKIIDAGSGGVYQQNVSNL